MTWIVLCSLIAFLMVYTGNGGAAPFYVLLAAVIWLVRRWRRRRSYPAGRSKAHGNTPALHREARREEKRLLAPEPKVLPDGSMGEQTYWERVMSEGGLSGSTLLRVEATPAGWEYRVELRSGSTLEQAQGARGALESAFDRRPGAITVEQDQERARVVVIKIQERAPTSDPLPWPGPPRGASIYDPVRLGAYIDHDGGPLEHPLAYQHVVIAGASGSGKSVVLNAEVAHVAACRDAIMVGCDLKGGVELGPWEPLMTRVATTTPQAEELLEWVVAMIEHRGPILKARHLRKWQFTPADPAIVVFIDEHARLSYSKRAREALEQIVEQGRALGIILVTCLQKPTKGALGSDRIGPNLTIRICLRVANTNEVAVALWPGAVSDGWAADEIRKSEPGTLYLHGPDAEYPRLARAFHVTDAKVDQAVRRLQVGTPRPGLAVAASPPAGAVPTDNTETDELGQDGGGEDDVLSILQAAPEPLRFSEIVIRSTASKATVARRLNAYRDARPPLVEQLEDKRWRAVS